MDKVREKILESVEKVRAGTSDSDAYIGKAYQTVNGKGYIMVFMPEIETGEDGKAKFKDGMPVFKKDKDGKMLIQLVKVFKAKK